MVVDADKLLKDLHFADKFALVDCPLSDGRLMWNCIPHNCYYHDVDSDCHGFHGCRIFCMMRDNKIYG